MNHDSPAEIRAELERRGLTLKKRWGQNFLINRGARDSMVGWLSPMPADRVWEIGPGLGAMTELLLKKSQACVVFEIDRGLCRYLEEAYGGTAGFTLVPGDFVKTWQGALQAHGSPDLLLGNLPYRSASLMIAAVIQGGLRPRAPCSPSSGRRRTACAHGQVSSHTRPSPFFVRQYSWRESLGS